MATFQSPGFAHYSLAWSPFLGNTIAVAASANYGLVGNGRLNILSVDPGLASGIIPQRQYVTALIQRESIVKSHGRPDSIPKTCCTTLHGVKPTRIKSSPVPETDLSGCGISR